MHNCGKNLNNRRHTENQWDNLTEMLAETEEFYGILRRFDGAISGKDVKICKKVSRVGFEWIWRVAQESLEPENMFVYIK